MELALATRADGEHTVLSVAGEVDVFTAPSLRDTFTQLVDDGHYRVVVDLEQVAFLDSTGLGVLVGGLKKVTAHDGYMRIVCTQERILKIFRITGLTQVFAIYETVDEALAAVV